MLLGKKQLKLNQFLWIYAAAMGGLILIFLGITGRLHWLFAFLGAAIPLLIRLYSVMNIAQQVKGASQYFGNLGSGPSTGQKSELNTAFLAMTLDHDTGHMDGRVLKGQFSGNLLSELELVQLRALYQELLSDSESLQVLEAYISRTHEDWQAESEHSTSSPGSGALNEAQALEILGLNTGASRDDILSAHRRLMQKVHPDRGGSNYLAAKINQAKDLLLGE